jgi:DNA repair exonuclease SbcCD nuclease subunit
VTDAVRPLRIAHLADTHLGYRAYHRVTPEGRNARMVDIERGLERAIDDVLTREVDLVLHAGDVFHHNRPAWSTLRVFVEQMRRLDLAGIPSVVIAGNHDTPRLRTTSTVYELLPLALPRVRFVTGWDLAEEEFPDLGLWVHAYPHGANTNPNLPTLLPVPGARNVLMAHGLAPGLHLAHQHEPGEERLTTAILSPEFDYVALGHYHLHGHQGGNAWYAGSTERMGWGDEPADPGYNLVTFAAPGEPPTVEHVSVTTRPMRTLPRIEAADLDARPLAELILDRARAAADPEAMLRFPVRGATRRVAGDARAIVRRETGDDVWLAEIKYEQQAAAGGEGPERTVLKPLPDLFVDFVAMRLADGAYDEGFSAFMRERGRPILEEAVRLSEEAAAEEAVS